VVILWKLRDESRHFKRSPANWTFVFALGFLTIALFSAVTSPYGNLEAALGGWGVLRYVASLLLLSTGCCVATRAYAAGRLDALLKLLFWLCTIAALSGYILPAIPGISNYLTFNDDTVRLQGVFGNVNEMGLQSGYPVVFGLALSFRSRRVYWLVLGSIAGAMGVIGSFSKTSMLMLLLLMVLVTWKGLRAGRTTPLVAVTATLMSLAAILGAMYLMIGIVQGTASIDLNAEQQRRVEQVSQLLRTGVLDDEATTGRTDIWEEGLNVWRRSPLLGCGLTTFDALPNGGMNSHNTFLVVLGESGLLGFALFVVMLCSWLTSIWRCRQRDVHALGLLFLAVQSALWMSNGQAMSLRGHNLVSGCVLGVLVIALLPNLHPPRT
jgi:O-antigen ligase